MIDKKSEKSLLIGRGNNLEDNIFSYLVSCKNLKVDGFRSVQDILGKAIRRLNIVIKPCVILDKCKKHDPQIVAVSDTGIHHYVMCKVCKLRGPYGINEQNAAELWNDIIEKYKKGCKK